MTDSAPFVDRERTDPEPATVALSTRDLTSTEQRALWSQTLDSTYCEMAVDWPSGSDGFAADIVARPVGSISVSVVRADPHTVVRTPSMIESDPGDDLLLCLITQGTATISQSGRSGVLCEGAFGFVDSAQPFVVRGETTFEQIVVRLGRDLLTPQVAENRLDKSLGQRFSAETGIDRVASNLLVDLASHDDDFTAGDLTAVTSAGTCANARCAGVMSTGLTVSVACGAAGSCPCGGGLEDVQPLSATAPSSSPAIAAAGPLTVLAPLRDRRVRSAPGREARTRRVCHSRPPQVAETP